MLSRQLFAHTLYVERKRSERSGRSFVLMLLESTSLLNPRGDHQTLDKVLLALSCSSRDTDTKGWYNEGSTIGVIFTELGSDADGQGCAAARPAIVATLWGSRGKPAAPTLEKHRVRHWRPDS